MSACVNPLLARIAMSFVTLLLRRILSSRRVFSRGQSFVLNPNDVQIRRPPNECPHDVAVKVFVSQQAQHDPAPALWPAPEVSRGDLDLAAVSLRFRDEQPP